MNEKQTPWIIHGYQVFAYKGPQHLKIERLSKEVGKNKSSFYHHFADLHVFTENLLSYHLQQAHLIAEKEAACISLPELIEVLVSYKVDLLFNRQLRVHRENRAYEACFMRTSQITTEAIIPLWAQVLELGDNTYLAKLVLQLSMENFYLQITDETLNRKWLASYFQELKNMVRALKQTGTPLPLDGSV